jgi:hypothetical protein
VTRLCSTGSTLDDDGSGPWRHEWEAQGRHADNRCSVLEDRLITRRGATDGRLRRLELDTVDRGYPPAHLLRRRHDAAHKRKTPQEGQLGVLGAQLRREATEPAGCRLVNQHHPWQTDWPARDRCGALYRHYQRTGPSEPTPRHSPAHQHHVANPRTGIVRETRAQLRHRIHGARHADLVHTHHQQPGSTGKTQQGKYCALHTIYDEREAAKVTGRINHMLTKSGRGDPSAMDRLSRSCRLSC